MLWFKFYLPLFQTYYHTLPYPKTKENKIYTKDKLNHNIYTDTRRTTESDSKTTDLFYSYQFFTKTSWFDASHSPDVRV